jgi:uncharacterized surface protein with fasciclin (FAS1) repeats
MSAVSGYSTSYSAIRDMHEDLSLAGAGNAEWEFLSGFSEDPYGPQPMLRWDEYMQWVLFNTEIPTAAQRDAALQKAIAAQEKTQPLDDTDKNYDTGVHGPLRKGGVATIYDVLASDPRLSKIKQLVDYVGYGKMYDQEFPITFFAPVNDRFDEILKWPLEIAYKPVAALQTLRYHILPYILKPWQMQDRKLRLRTDLDRQFLESDWTRGKQLLLNPVTLDRISPPAGSFTNPPGDPYNGRADSWFPKREWEVKFLSGPIECANGVLYIVDRPVVPADLL